MFPRKRISHRPSGRLPSSACAGPWILHLCRFGGYSVTCLMWPANLWRDCHTSSEEAHCILFQGSQESAPLSICPFAFPSYCFFTSNCPLPKFVSHHIMSASQICFLLFFSYDKFRPLSFPTRFTTIVFNMPISCLPLPINSVPCHKIDLSKT